MSDVENVQSYLASAELVDGSSGWPCIRRRVLDTAGDRIVVITEDGGFPPEIGASLGMGDAAFSFPAVQVRVRAGPWDGDSSHDKAQEIYDVLHGLEGATLGSTVYAKVSAMTSQPVFIGFDSKGRPEHTISFQLTRPQPAPII